MQTAPHERSRRSLRTGQALTLESLNGPADAADSSSEPTGAGGSRGSSFSPASRGPAPWVFLAAAGGALLVGIAVGLLISIGVGGALGRSIGATLASLLVAATALALLPRVRVRGSRALRALDVLWGIVVGLVLPFVGGAFALSSAWPAYASLSPRWIVLGVVAPVVMFVCLAVFAVGLVFPATRRTLSPRFGSAVARTVAAVLCAVAFVAIPVVFHGDVSGMPVALPIVLGIGLGVFARLSLRLWGPLIAAAVFAAVWVALAVLGALLA